MQTEVVASLEGMRVVITSAICELCEYNFAENGWATLEARRWPLQQEIAERWLNGWNAVDRFKALNLLTASVPE